MITLEWMNLIRRMKERNLNSETILENLIVYGIEEEKRITKEFN